MAHPDTAGFTGRIALGLLIGFGAALGQAQPLDRAADALLTIDQHRASVVERIVDGWGPALAKSGAHVSVDELRTRLLALRADRLLAASLAGTLDGLREVIGVEAPSSILAKPGLAPTKALGDSTADIVYTPVTPCRLVETRGTFAAVYQGNGTAAHTPVPFPPNQIRSYTLQGGNGVCLTQLPAGLAASAVQLQVFGMPTTPASGDIEILPQGTAFGSTATMVYIATIAFNTVSTAAKVNIANHQISVQVRGGGAHLAIDVVGYFAAPTGSGGAFFRQGGNAIGTTALLGTIDNQPLNVQVNGQRVMRYEPNANGPNVIGGHPDNQVSPQFNGQTIAGGGIEAQCFISTRGGEVPCTNETTQQAAAVGGGYANLASGTAATVAGGSGNAATDVAATVAGGSANVASGGFAAIGGGSGNVASGSFSIVAGGISSAASANHSFAAGRRAKATTTGSFIWADSQNFDFQPSVSNFFGVRATGGVGLTVAINPATGGVTQFCNLLPGVASWQCTSDREAKENFRPVDSEDVLRHLVAMPLPTWNFKGADPSLRLLGPTAQDFRAAFGLGNDDKTIIATNLHGVALAAIQGLNRKLEQQVGEQRHQIEVLDRRVAEIAALREEISLLKVLLIESRSTAGPSPAATRAQ